jgi:hypothetical protein
VNTLPAEHNIDGTVVALMRADGSIEFAFLVTSR